MAILAVACGPAGTASNEQAPANGVQSAVTRQQGWTSGRDEDGPHLQYSWGDASGVLFSGICPGHPVLLLDGGDYSRGATTFALLVDDQRWELETFASEDGRALFIDVPAIIDRMANARQRIVFRVGTWSREIAPNPLIQEFVRTCRSAP